MARFIIWIFKKKDIFAKNDNLFRKSLTGGCSISPNLPKTPKMPNIADFFKIYITNYFVGVMLHDLCMKSFSWLNFPNLLFSTLFWLRLVVYLILRILMIYFIRINCEPISKIKWNVWHIRSIYDVIRFFSFFEQKTYFCSHIAECADIAEIFPPLQ